MKTGTIFLLFFLSFKVVSGEFRVLTLNVYRKPEIGGGFFGTERMSKICEVLKHKAHPHNRNWDIVLLQEVWTVGARKALKDCGYKYHVDIGSEQWRVSDRQRFRRGGFRPRPGRHGSELNLGSGLLILSKFPILKSIRYKFKNGGRLTRVFNDGEVMVDKSVYLIQTRLPTGEKIWVANTHLIANYCEFPGRAGCSSYEETRTRQMIEMRKVFDEFVGDDPILFGGDLNAGEHPNAKDKSWLMMPEIFPDFVQAPHNEVAVLTSSPDNYFNRGHGEGGKLDHIFASSHFSIDEGALAFEEAIESESGKSINYSDHYGWESRLILR